VAKLDTRLELRLDRQTYERLERRAAEDRLSVAEVVRQAIVRELEGDEQPWRAKAVERGVALNMPVPQDPADLVRELDAAYEASLPE
jgi:hypothetical protein